MELSIIIPVYNVEDYLRDCLDSVFSQNLNVIEVICVNDGSTDGSKHILQEFKEKYPSLILYDRINGGLSAARNSGLALAKGKYIYFLDSDDYLLPAITRLMISFVAENELDIACFNAQIGENKSYFVNKVNPFEVQSGIDYYANNYKQNGFFPPSAVWMYVYKRDFLEKNELYFKEGFIHEDEQFSPRAFFFAKRVKLLNLPIQFHRVAREGAITYQIGKRNLIDLVSNSEDLYHFFLKQNCKEDIFYHKIFENYLTVANNIIECYPYEKWKYFSNSSFNIMKSCVINWEWYVYYWFFRYSVSLFKWYQTDKFLPIKKVLNKCFKLYYLMLGRC